MAGRESVDTQLVRREYVRRIVALVPVIDQVLGESSQIRYYSLVLERAVDGYVTNLLAQLSDCLNVGVNTISAVDADSFWIDGYFEETNLAPIRVRDPTEIRPMGYSPTVHGTGRLHHPRDQRREHTAERPRRCHGQSDLHLGPARAENPCAYPHRSSAGGHRTRGENDRRDQNR